ncbi:hypothetical protein WBG99_32025 [Streptomyces sp. TG1A-60]|uniref:hypothetical protein n=1 Tax=Streptomyces sp. TG1A-60 TaxID=3129111 RepID=UPI0030D0A5B7
MRVVTNLLGNCAAVFAVSEWECALAAGRAKMTLDGEFRFVEEGDEPGAGGTDDSSGAPLGTHEGGVPARPTAEAKELAPK